MGITLLEIDFQECKLPPWQVKIYARQYSQYHNPNGPLSKKLLLGVITLLEIDFQECKHHPWQVKIYTFYAFQNMEIDLHVFFGNRAVDFQENMEIDFQECKPTQK